MTEQLPRNLARTGAMTAVAALVGSAATGSPSKTAWFKRLRKPSIQPPAVVFPVVWTALYADIAVSSAVTLDQLSDENRDAEARAYTAALAANLAINASWTWVFFRSRNLVVAPIVAAVLAASSADLARRSGQANRKAGIALVPYAAWCTFATVLSTAIWRKNQS